MEDGALIRSGTQLQEAHNDQQIEGTYKTMLKKLILTTIKCKKIWSNMNADIGTQISYDLLSNFNAFFKIITHNNFKQELRSLAQEVTHRFLR